MTVGKHFGRPGVCRRYSAQITGYTLQDLGPERYRGESWIKHERTQDQVDESDDKAGQCS